MHRFALTHDFVTYEQAFYLSPTAISIPSRASLGYPFWQDHGSFLLWPLAFLDWLWPHPTTLLWLQDAAAAGAEAVAFLWVCDLASIRAGKTPDHRAVWACVCLALIPLVINPWILWAVSNNFHPEPLATLWLVAAARDLFAGRRRAWVWIALALLTGDVGASYCAALGLSAMTAGRRWWRTGLAVACVGVVWMVLLGAIHATKGTVLGYYAPLFLGHTGSIPAGTTSFAVLKAVDPASGAGDQRLLGQPPQRLGRPLGRRAARPRVATGIRAAATGAARERSGARAIFFGAGLAELPGPRVRCARHRGDLPEASREGRARDDACYSRRYCWRWR